MNLGKRKFKSYSATARNYLFLVSSIVILFFVVIITLFEINKFSSDSSHLRKQIYLEKQINVKMQVQTAVETINLLKDSLEHKMHHSLVKRVDEAYGIAVNIYNITKGKYPEKQIKELIKDALRPARFFNSRGYYFIYDREGECILYPVHESLEGTNLRNLRTSGGDYPVAELIKQSGLRDRNFTDYYWEYVEDNPGFSFKKTAYYRNLPFYNWVLGVSDYYKFIENEVKKQAISKIEEIKYDKDGFVFIFHLNGDIVLTKDENINKMGSVIGFKDADGQNMLALSAHNAFKEEGGFFEYRMYDEYWKEVRKQIAYVSFITDWEWIVGGFVDIETVEDLINSNKSTILNELYISLIIIFIFLLVLIIIIWQIGRKIKERIQNRFVLIYNNFENSVKSHSYIKEDASIFIEEKEFIIGINRLLKMNNKNIAKLVKREKELEIINASKDRFFSIIAHDLKNPFNSLLGILEILLEDYDSLDDKERKEYLEVLSESSNKLFNLLSELLQWARLQTTGIECNFVEISIDELIKREINNLDTQRAEKKIEIITDIPADIKVNVDENMILTVFRNLLSNAIKFTHIGGNIKLYTKQHNNNIIISIEDDGVGMSEQMISKLFKLEEKLTSIGTNNEVGTGLGLILCKEFLEKNNGEIKVSSKEGIGSVFSIYLPILAK